MHQISFTVILQCYVILLVAASKLQQNFTIDTTIQYESDTKFMKDHVERIHMRHNLRQNFIRGDNTMYNHESFANITEESHRETDVMEYGFYENMTENYKDVNDGMLNIDVNSTETEKSNYTRFTILVEDGDLNESSKNNTAYINSTCILFCCPLGDHLIKKECINREGNYSFPIIYNEYPTTNSSQIQDIIDNEMLDHTFNWTINPYQKIGRYQIKADECRFFANGSLYQPFRRTFSKLKICCFVDCNQNKIINDNSKKTTYQILVSIAIIASLPCLLAVIVIYSILPELQNIHGYTLRAYVSSLFVTYVILVVHKETLVLQFGYIICFILAVFFTFSTMATFFWLNIMCFDIWWMFRKPYSSRRSARYQDRKKFTLYALYGWGCPSILVIICLTMEFGFAQQNLIQPKFCTIKHWFSDIRTTTYYFYIPMGITIFCNILLFVSTAFTIAHYKKNTDQHLKNSANKGYDDKKQWSKMYIKLFILMGISWISEIISAQISVSNDLQTYIFHPIDIINALQGVIIFIIFVWKKKIGLMLMKRFSFLNIFCHKCSSGDEHSTSTSRTTSLGTVSLQSVSCNQIVNAEGLSKRNNTNNAEWKEEILHQA